MESSLERVLGRPSNSSVESSSEVPLGSYFPENKRGRRKQREKGGKGREGEERMRGEAWLAGSGGGTESERIMDTTTVASRNQMATVRLTLHITSLPTTVTSGFLVRTPNVS